MQYARCALALAFQMSSWSTPPTVILSTIKYRWSGLFGATLLVTILLTVVCVECFNAANCNVPLDYVDAGLGIAWKAHAKLLEFRVSRVSAGLRLVAGIGQRKRANRQRVPQGHSSLRRHVFLPARSLTGRYGIRCVIADSLL